VPALEEGTGAAATETGSDQSTEAAPPDDGPDSPTP
jgi:hypothetical protein